MKKLFFVFIAILICIGLFAKTETPIQDKSPRSTIVNATDDLWDVFLQFDVDTPSGQVGLAGMEWDGTYFYATKWSGSNQLFQFDAAGNYIAPITVPLTGCRDVAHDGTYFYGSPASASVSCWEPTTGTAVPANNINVAGALVRAIAYDEVTDTFWSGNWSDNIVNWNRSGTILGTNPWAGSLYGLAYDNDPQGPYLYAHSQDTGCVAYQLDPNNGLAQISVMDYTSIGGTGAIAGGACAMTDWDPAYRTIGLLLQGTPDYIVVIEAAIGSDPNAPGAPTDVAVIPDAGGALEALVTWVCPSVTVGGAALTDLDEMRVYRDGALIYTDTNPAIGGPGTYTDAGLPVSGNYNYSIVGFNDVGEGIPVAYSTWIGEDVPACVENLLLEGMAGNGYLTWTNPTVGLNGGAFNNPIVGYHITRSPDNIVFELAGIATSYTDTTIPGADYYSYTVVPYNVIGDGGSATSNTSMIGAGVELFMDDFENGLGNWTINNNGQPGGWMIYGAGAFPNVYTLPPTSTGSVCAADADETYPVNSEMILATALDLSTYDTANIQFDNDWQAIAVGDYAYVDVSIDGGANWTNVLTFDDVDVRMTHEIVDITAVAAGQSNVTIRFYSVQPGWDWWWAIDNVGVYGTGGGVTLDPPTNLAVESNTNEDFATFTWDAPSTPFSWVDDMDSYTAGEYLALQSDDWTTWSGTPGGADDGYVVDVNPYSGLNSLKVEGTSTDLVHEFGTFTSGVYEATMMIYIESGYGGYYNLLHYFNGSSSEWGMEVYFGSTGTGQLCATLQNVTSFTHPVGAWFESKCVIDLDADWAEYYIDGTMIYEWQWSIDTNGTPGSCEFGATDIYASAPTGDTVMFYCDDVTLTSIVDRELTGYNVYLDGVMQDFTTDTEWIFEDLTNGVTYTAAVEAVYDEGVSVLMEIDFVYMGLGAGNDIVPRNVLSNNYPNPFNPSTNIAFTLANTGHVTLEVFNIKGEKVKTLVDEVLSADRHIITWNGNNDTGKPVASGIYFYKMKANKFVSTKKMILMK